MDIQKVFGIGLPKTGTTSLHVALQELDLSSIHFPVSMQEIAAHDAAVNLPVSFQFETLDHQFPGSKFILTVREIQSWLASCEEQYSGAPEMDISPMKEEFLSFFLNLREKSFGVRYYEPAKFEEAHNAHLERVRDYFKNRPGDLLVLDLFSGQGWREICEFLSLTEPITPFAHVNSHRSLVPELNEDIVKRLKLTASESWIG